ncbi:hypothetical protein L1049_007918 [Liquidambar formosana]|uniref:Protein FAR1-RELATED SEQUENCE n=1 Tax=Liquidambar formosana TaxID=63359 RepID=A0AAP0S9Y5_LIQFO
MLDKKNVRRIPPQYILKQWTIDAKARSITNYDGVEIHDNPKESMGKRYGHLCHNFHEIASCAAEHEKLSAYAHERSVELLRDFEEMKKKLCFENVRVQKNSQGSEDRMALPDNIVTTKESLALTSGLPQINDGNKELNDSEQMPSPNGD